MRIGQFYSHLNGLEFLLVHRPNLWEEIQAAIWNVDAGKAFGKISQEKTMVGRELYSPRMLNVLFKHEFFSRGWQDMRRRPWTSGTRRHSARPFSPWASRPTAPITKWTS